MAIDQVVVAIDFIGRDKNASATARKIRRAVTQTQKDVEKSAADMAKLEAASYRAAANIGRDFEQLGRGIQSAGDTISNFAAGLFAITTVPLALGMYAAAEAAINFESAFAGVIKTVDGLVVGGTLAELNQQGLDLRQGLIDLSREIPTTADELARIGELAGQLGVGAGDIQLFTRVIAEFVESTDVELEDAAKAIAQISNVFDDEVSDRFGGSISRFADSTTNAIVDLGNNFATTESEILQFFQTFAGNAAGAKISVSDTLAISTAFRSVRAQSAASSTALQRFFQSLQTSATNSVQDLQPFLDVVNAVGTTAEGSFGVASDALKELALNDPGEALFLFLRGLREYGPDIPNVLASLGLGDRRLIRELNKAAGGVDQLRAALDLSAKAFGEFGENGARAIEASRRFDTVASQLQILKNDAIALGIAIGDRLIPHIENLAETAREELADMIKWWERVDDSQIDAWISAIKLWTAFLGTVFAIGKLVSVGGSAIQTFGLLSSGFNSLKADMAVFKASQLAINTAIAEGGEALSTGAQNIGKYETSFGRLLGKFSAGSILKISLVIGALVAVGVALFKMKESADKTSDAIIDAVEQVRDGSEPFRQMSDDLGILADSTYDAQKALIDSTDTYEEYYDLLSAAGGAQDAYTEAQYDSAKGADTLQEAIEGSAEMLEAYKDVIGDLSWWERVSRFVFRKGSQKAEDYTLEGLISSVGIYKQGTDKAAESVEVLISRVNELNKLEEFDLFTNNGRDPLGDEDQIRQYADALLERGATFEQVFQEVERVLGDERAAMAVLLNAFEEELGLDFSSTVNPFETGWTLPEEADDFYKNLLVEYFSSLSDEADDTVQSLENVAEVVRDIGVLDLREQALLQFLENIPGAAANVEASILGMIRNIDLSRLTPEMLGLTDEQATNFGFDFETQTWTDASLALSAVSFSLQQADNDFLALSNTQDITLAAFIQWLSVLPSMTDEVGKVNTKLDLMETAFTALGLTVGEIFSENLSDAIDTSLALVQAQESLKLAFEQADPEARKEAYSNLVEAQNDLIESNNNLILEISRTDLVINDAGEYETQVREIDEATIDLAESLGVYTKAEADAIKQRIRSRDAQEDLVEIGKFLGLSDRELAAAQILLREGLVDSTEAAIGAVQANEDYIEGAFRLNKELVQSADAFTNASNAAEEYAETIVAATIAQNEAFESSVEAGRGLVEEIFNQEIPGIRLDVGLDNFSFDRTESEFEDLKGLFRQTAFDIYTAAQDELTALDKLELEMDFGLITPERFQFEQDIINIQSSLRTAFGTILIEGVPIDLTARLGDFNEDQLIQEVVETSKTVGEDISNLLSFIALISMEYNLDEEETGKLKTLILEGVQSGLSEAEAALGAVQQIIPVEQTYSISTSSATLVEGADAATLAVPDFLDPEGVDVPISITVPELESKLAELQSISTAADLVVGEEARQIIYETNLQEVTTETNSYQTLAASLEGEVFNINFDDQSVLDAIENVQILNEEAKDKTVTIRYILETIGEAPSGAGSAGGGTPPPPPDEDNQWGGGLIGGINGHEKNLSWLTKGEYVMPTHAMRESGVKDFMDSLRAGLSLGAAMRRVGGIDTSGVPNYVTPIVAGATNASVYNDNRRIDNSRNLDVKVQSRASRARTAAYSRQTWGRF